MIVIVSSIKNEECVDFLIEKEKLTHYLYLGNYDSVYEKIGENLKNKLIRSNSAGELNQIVESELADYLTYYTSFSNSNANNFRWWFSRVSEHNPMISNMFINFCRLRLLERVISERRFTGLLLIVDEYSLGLQIESFLRERGVQYTYYQKKLHIPLIQSIFSCIHVSLEYFIKIINIRKKIPLPPYHQLRDNYLNPILIHSYFSKNQLIKPCPFSDIVFGDLIPYLEKKGRPVFFILSLMEKVDAGIIHQQLSCYDKKIIVPFSLFGVTDFAGMLITMFYHLIVPVRCIPHKGIDLRILFRQEQRKYASHTALPYLYYRLIRRLWKMGFKIEVLLDAYEGMILEKGLLIGLNKYYPQSDSIGFLHVPLSKKFLCLFTHNKFLKSPVLPKKIICTGKMMKEYLATGNLPEDRIKTGCALRQSYLYDFFNSRALINPNEGSSMRILVTLPLSQTSASSLMNKLQLSFKELNHVCFNLKPHPFIGQEFIDCQETIYKEYPNVHFVSGSMKDWLGNSQIIISSEGSSSIEALVFGLPVLIVGSTVSLNLISLDWIETSFSDPYFQDKEILDRLVVLIKDYSRYKKTAEMEGENLLHGLFNPVSDQCLEKMVSVSIL